MHKIGIIGGGSWGTALAQAASHKNDKILIWTQNREVLQTINEKQVNQYYLPGCYLSKHIRATDQFKDLLAMDMLFYVTPAQYLRQHLENYASQIPSWTPLVICSKGIEKKTGLLMSEVVEQFLPSNPIIILSGPNFAHEVAQNLPTATTIATKDREMGKLIVQAIGSQTFRPYYCNDPIGAQISGALKNVYAIASGITYGRSLGDNARVALMTRSLAEMARLGIHLGADYKSFLGLAGIGDLTLTTSSPSSRNMRLGIAMGEGKNPEKFMQSENNTFEGYYTAASVINIAVKYNIDMPIARSVYEILYQGADVKQTIENLMLRPFTDDVLLKENFLK